MCIEYACKTRRKVWKNISQTYEKTWLLCERFPADVKTATELWHSRSCRHEWACNTGSGDDFCPPDSRPKTWCICLYVSQGPRNKTDTTWIKIKYSFNSLLSQHDSEKSAARSHLCPSFHYCETPLANRVSYDGLESLETVHHHTHQGRDKHDKLSPSVNTETWTVSWQVLSTELTALLRDGQPLVMTAKIDFDVSTHTPTPTHADTCNESVRFNVGVHGNYFRIKNSYIWILNPSCNTHDLKGAVMTSTDPRLEAPGEINCCMVSDSTEWQQI